MNNNERDERWWEQWWLHDPEAWRGTWREDWRIMGQEGYLLKRHLQHRRFCRDICKEDFTQCEFCYAVFDKESDNPLTAYFEPLGRYWVCEECYNDFQQYFKWTVEDLTHNDLLQQNNGFV